MVTTAIPHTANSYWSVVKHLSADAKRDLITLLSKSLNSTTANKVSAKKYYGIWGDDGMTDDEFVNELHPMRSFKSDIIELYCCT